MPQVTIQSVANNTFPAVRADINSQLAALYSNNSGATAPVNPVPYQMWADTTANLLKMRNAANSTWVVIGPLETANLGFALASSGTLINPTVTGGTFSSPNLTGSPVAPTLAITDTSTKLANTLWVDKKFTLFNSSITGTLTLTTGVWGVLGSPLSMTVDALGDYTATLSSGLITIPYSGLYSFTSSAVFFANGTSGAKVFTGYVGIVTNTGSYFLMGTGGSVLVGNDLYNGISIALAVSDSDRLRLSAGQTVRPAYIANTSGGANSPSVAPSSFFIQRIGN